MSDWHRLRWDELWHFYEGGLLMLEVIDQDGELKKLVTILPVVLNFSRWCPGIVGSEHTVRGIIRWWDVR